LEGSREVSVKWAISKYEKLYLSLTLKIQFSRCFHHVLNALTSQAIYDEYIKFPTADIPTLKEIESNLQFFPFFKDTLGAVDGTHILVHPLASDCVCY
jgi:hypothetical protein